MAWRRWGTRFEVPEDGWVAFSWPPAADSLGKRREDLILVKQDGKISCFVDRCSHQDIKLSEFGAIQSGAIICFAHNARFACRDGQVLCPPAEQGLTLWPCQVSGDEIHLALAMQEGI